MKAPHWFADGHKQEVGDIGMYYIYRIINKWRETSFTIDMNGTGRVNCCA